jgi:histidinol-phosphatase (PHP family)
MVGDSTAFMVLAHIDYPLRYWPSGDFSVREFEDDFRHVLGAAAQAGLALEFNTELPMDAQILAWWHEEGGQAITFGSDAHQPDHLARRFSDAASLASSCGFRPATDPTSLWHRA